MNGNTNNDNIAIGNDINTNNNEGESKTNRLNNPYVITTLVLLNIIWGYNIYKRVNKMLSINYSNVIYQIRKPDSISNRFLAFKYLVLGGSVVPISSLSLIYYTNFRNSNPNKRIQHGEMENLNMRNNISNYIEESSKNTTNTHSNYTTNYNTGLFIDNLNGVLSKYSNNANVRLEHFSENIKKFVPSDNFKNMGLDLKKDINKLKGWMSNLF